MKKSLGRRKSKKKSTNHHESSTTGRIAELYFASLMLSNGYELYQPVVDVAVDYLAKGKGGKEIRFQCKCRSKLTDTVFDLSVPKDKRVSPPTHVFYMRGPVQDAEFWIVPFTVVKRLSKKGTGKTGRKIFRIYLTVKVLKALRDFRREYGLEELKKWCIESIK
jgi:hypothetical protein